MLHGVFARRLPRLLLASGVVLVIVVAVGLATLVGGGWVSRPAAEPGFDAETASMGSPAAARSALGVLLDVAAARADGLATLGEARSRDLLALANGQRDLRVTLDEIDRQLAAATPAGESGAIASYRAGASHARTALAQGQGAVLRFDWDAVAQSTALLRQSATELARAAAAIR